ncbi:TPA: adenosylcobinamide-GDP ribazoletransferase [Candidatus Latescibacteria bacterium]|nr:adenosylcobinamide-GDP ribazoletransferase [Candidatus Latescibacterota bacterium]
MSGFWAALRFLTVLPAPSDWGVDTDALSRSKPWFPVIGLLIGLAAVAVSLVLDHLLPDAIASVLLVAFLLSVSRGLHADGLADTADGFFSNKPRERILDIMRDSRIGTFGVLALAFVVLLKVAGLDAASNGSRLAAVFLAPMAGRCAMIQMLSTLPYAREEGLATVFYSRSTRSAVVVSTFSLFGLAFAVCGVPGLIVAAISTGMTHLFCVKCRRLIGGATGDTMGAACELAETAVLALAVAIQVTPPLMDFLKQDI